MNCIALLIFYASSTFTRMLFYVAPPTVVQLNQISYIRLFVITCRLLVPKIISFSQNFSKIQAKMCVGVIFGSRSIWKCTSVSQCWGNRHSTCGNQWRRSRTVLSSDDTGAGCWCPSDDNASQWCHHYIINGIKLCQQNTNITANNVSLSYNYILIYTFCH